MQSDKQSGNKVMVGFKCNVSLRISLTQQAERLGITLSSHVETSLLSLESKDDQLRTLTEKVNILERQLSLYEQNPFLLTLFNQYKGQTLSCTNQEGKKIALTITSTEDIFTLIVNSFKNGK